MWMKNSLPSPKIKSYREAIQSLEDSQIFLDSRGCLETAAHAKVGPRWAKTH